MKRYDKLIFVSNSDTSRGPMAEAILSSKFLLEELEVESKAWVSLFPEPINQKAEAVLVSHGLSMKEHMSSQLVERDLDERTLMLVLEDSLKQKIYEEYNHVENVYLLTEYIGYSGEILNPLGGKLTDYGICFETMEEMISKLVVILNEQELLTE